MLQDQTNENAVSSILGMYVTMESTAQTLCNFNFSFCSNMAAHLSLKEMEKGRNFVFSPLSFHSMLSLIAVGSKGSALVQLLSFLRSESINELNHSASQINSLVLLTEHEDHNFKNNPILSFVNGIWVDQRFGLKPSFTQVLEGIYHATVKEVDFANKADQVTDEVNGWIETATKGLIRNIIPQFSLSNDTALVLANALYFKGVWDRKFDPSKTEHRAFYLLNGQIVEVPFMTSKWYEKHLYGSFDGYKVVKIPYQKNSQDSRQFSMYFFLPDARDGLHNLIQNFKSNPELYSEQIVLQEEDLPKFWIPRFKFSFKFEASQTLKELGLELPFSPLGEFTEMVDSPKSLVLSKIYHESCVEVNEEGTEAAASTAPQFIMLSAKLNPPSFVADHPFLFTIKEENSGMLFFVGAVLNPFLGS